MERIVQNCPSCGTDIPPVNLWKGGVCLLSRSFCTKCHYFFEAAYYDIGCFIEDACLWRLREEQVFTSGEDPTSSGSPERARRYRAWMGYTTAHVARVQEQRKLGAYQTS